MTNTASIALLGILALLALTVWKIHSGKGLATVNGQPSNYRTAWTAALLAIVIAVATDLNSDLGAAIAAAVLIGVLARALSAPKGQKQGPVAQALGEGQNSIPLGPQLPAQRLPSSPQGAQTPGGVPVPSAPTPVTPQQAAGVLAL